MPSDHTHDPRPDRTDIYNYSSGRGVGGVVIGVIIALFVILGAVYFIGGGDVTDESGATLNIEATPSADVGATAGATDTATPPASDPGEAAAADSDNSAGGAEAGADATATTGN